MRRYLAWNCLLTIAGFAAATFGQMQGQESAPDPTGIWTWSTPTQSVPGSTTNGGRTNTLTLSLEHGKLADTLTTAPPVEDLFPPFPLTKSVDRRKADAFIGNIALSGDQIRFTVTYVFKGAKAVTRNAGTGAAVTPVTVVERRSDKFTAQYSGKIQRDTIQGKCKFGWNGKIQTAEWIARRQGPS